MPQANQRQQAVPRHQWTPILAKGQCCHGQQPRSKSASTNPGFPGFSILSLMEPLRQAPLVIPQIIMSLCAISFATCNKLCEIMTPFHGDKKRPRINVTMGDTTFNWLFDTGAAITCIYANSFRQAFKKSKPRLITNGNGCVAANGNELFGGL
jgi:Retroviral aspartyl protease